MTDRSVSPEEDAGTVPPGVPLPVPPPLEDQVLLHLLAHHAYGTRFEADKSTTEIGLQRAFAQHEGSVLKHVVVSLEAAHLIARRSQYVVGYSEPKTVYVLTPLGRQRAIGLLTSESCGEEV